MGCTNCICFDIYYYIRYSFKIVRNGYRNCSTFYYSIYYFIFTKFTIPEETYCPEDITRPIKVDAGEFVKQWAEQYYAGPDPIGKTHTREGVVVRIVNRPKFTAYKHKNFEFKVLEGIIKECAEAPDMEEAQEEVDA